MWLAEWKTTVRKAIEKANKDRLLEECYRSEGEDKIPKTKTAKIVDELKKTSYKRCANDVLLKCTKQETKTVMIARFGMLECGKNFKGSRSEMCDTCKQMDNEDHRLNHCEKYKTINFFNSCAKVDFEQIYSNDLSVLRELMSNLSCVWNTYNAYGSINVTWSLYNDIPFWS